MNVEKVIKELSQEYPGKQVIKNEEKNPTEILCEIDPTTDHPERSVAIAVIDKSKPHYHKKTKETYEVIRGSLTINKNGQDFHLREGEKLVIEPGETHFAFGNETWIRVYSEPGWVLEDHILVD
ncbi:MAG: cupin domain-containing protein [Candidatus Azambacteria bacterium]|nr:cupin domain-containing protein [Candidatus Azambacteria bacterium]